MPRSASASRRYWPSRRGGPEMRKFWLALLFLAGGAAYEARHPLTCESVPVRRQLWPGRRR